jgi:CheY-like chemotaxis protein
MTILVVEDEPHKLAQVLEALSDLLPTAKFVCRGSYRTAADCIFCEDPPDLCVLDMTLPTFEQSVEERGGRERPFGGRDLMMDIDRAGKKLPALVVTQYDAFVERYGGVRALRTSKEVLDGQLRRRFGRNYLGLVSYDPLGTEWKQHLAAGLRKVIK